MFWLGIAMTVTALAVYVALLPKGGEPRLKSDHAQAYSLIMLMVVFLVGVLFIFGVH